MPALPDQFDLWVRRARHATPERQIDWLLGALYALNEWFFYNQGDEQKPIPAAVEVEGVRSVVIFSAAGKLQDFVESGGHDVTSVPSIAIRVPDATAYCLLFREAGCGALLVNPGDYAFMVDLSALEKFDAGWKARRNESSRGFWIPNMTSEEEDFWQQHGL